MKLNLYAPIALLSIYSALSASQEAGSISQHGITWTFDGDYPVGQYCNGDWWVQGPLSIIQIQPHSTNTEGWIKNGSTLNPRIGQEQGFDSSIDVLTYKEEDNVNPSITGEDLQVSSGSLISTVSKQTANNRPQLKAAAILTIVEERPPEGAFRPPLVSDSKQSAWTKHDLDYSILQNLPSNSHTPSLAPLIEGTRRPWIELNTSWTGRYIHPSDNQPDYGRDISSLLGTALLALQFDFDALDKEPLFINIVQYGLDVYGSAEAGAVWEDLGGHNHGRKLPLLLAGKALDDAAILQYGNASSHFIFQEDRQTWYVTEEDVGRPLYQKDNRLRETYISSDIGIAEWGEQHTRNPSRDARNWDAHYRDIVGSSIMSHAIAARLMKLENEWNWPAFFDYMDRFYAIGSADSGGGTNFIKELDANIYENYLQSSLLPSAPSGLTAN